MVPSRVETAPLVKSQMMYFDTNRLHLTWGQKHLWYILAWMTIEWKVLTGSFDDPVLLTLRQRFRTHANVESVCCIRSESVFVWCVFLMYNLSKNTNFGCVRKHTHMRAPRCFVFPSQVTSRLLQSYPLCSAWLRMLIPISGRWLRWLWQKQVKGIDCSFCTDKTFFQDFLWKVTLVASLPVYFTSEHTSPLVFVVCQQNIGVCNVKLSFFVFLSGKNIGSSRLRSKELSEIIMR